MKNNATKQEWVLHELRAVEEKYKGKHVDTFAINIYQMAKDCGDVIEDMQSYITMLQKELANERATLFSAQQELLKETLAREEMNANQLYNDVMRVRPMTDSEALTADSIAESIQAEELGEMLMESAKSKEAEKHNALLEKMQAQMKRGYNEQVEVRGEYPCE